MKKIFMAAFFKEVAKSFKVFEPDLSGKRVTFIPTASNVEKVTFYVKSGKKELEKMGLIIDVLELSSASYDEISSKIINNDYIYVTGGNTFYLLQELKRTKADEIIINQVSSGKVYIGESAGAIITSKNIEYVSKMDSIKKAPELTNYDALGLVEFYPVPHYESSPFKKVAQNIITSYSSKIELMPFTNKEAITIDKDEIKILQ